MLIQGVLRVCVRRLQRWQHAAVVHEGSIFILGGWGMVMLDDVWKTSDGVNWIKVRTSHTQGMP